MPLYKNLRTFGYAAKNNLLLRTQNQFEVRLIKNTLMFYHDLGYMKFLNVQNV